MQERLARLTEGQRECLRMVYRHMETKEIARSLGISPDGVSQRIKTAMRTLGVHRRRDAALMLAESEGLSPYPPQVHLPRDIAAMPQFAAQNASTGHERRQRGQATAGEMRERQADFHAVSSPPAKGFQLPLPVWGGKPADLGALQRLGWVFGLILVIALVFGVFVAGVEALSRLGRAIN